MGSHEKAPDEFSQLAGGGPNPAKWKTIPCKFFEMGKCKKGDACPFIHPKEGNWPELQPENDQGGSTSNQSSNNQWSDWSQPGNNQGANQWTDAGGKGGPDGKGGPG